MIVNKAESPSLPVIETIPDAQRQLLIVLVTRAYVEIRDDLDMAAQTEECEALIKRLSGETTRLLVVRTTPSGAR